MPLNLEFRQSRREFRSLQEWEQRLSIPARTLLHHASQGRLNLFVRPPAMAVEYALFRADEAASPLTQGPFIRLPKDELVGFIPDATILSAMICGQPADIESFNTVICDNLSWDGIRGLFPSTYGHTFQPFGWRIGIFRPLEAHESPNETAAPDLSHAEIDGRCVTRCSFAIRPDHVCIRDVDVRTFLDSLQSHDFISDLHKSGAFTEEFPAYISGKLKEIIEANQVLWSKWEGLGADVRDRKRAASVEYLSTDFRSLCKKGTSPDALVKFAADVCDPSTVPESRRIGSSATPDMLALVTAAKLFWSPVYIDSGRPETHPAREEAMAFLRFMGMTATNAASDGVTIIRPEQAIAGKFGEQPPFFRPLPTRRLGRPTRPAA